MLSFFCAGVPDSRSTRAVIVGGSAADAADTAGPSAALLVELVRQPVLPDNVLGWLYRVVRNGAVSAARAEVAFDLSR
jgi:hypothetical protein